LPEGDHIPFKHFIEKNVFHVIKTHTNERYASIYMLLQKNLFRFTVPWL